jgi:hypothetical protein
MPQGSRHSGQAHCRSLILSSKLYWGMALDLRFACLLSQLLCSQNHYEEVFSDSPLCHTAANETLNLNNSSNFVEIKMGCIRGPEGVY